MPERRGLLASPGLDAHPVKGVYFFPGEASKNLDLYTTHPLLADDRHWNSDPCSRARVMARIAASHANTVVMSYWGNMDRWSPMTLDSTSVPAVVDAVKGQRLVIMPAIECGFEPNHPEIPHWEFAQDFPSPSSNGPPAPGLIERIGELVELFRARDRMDLWARLYDREGRPRYAIQLLHVYSAIPGTTRDGFAAGFARVADHVRAAHDIDVGFCLDVIRHRDATYIAAPDMAGASLEAQPSVLAISGFASEVFSGKVRKSQPGEPPVDNNVENLVALADWKRGAVGEWAKTRLPLILDVSNGNDGRFVWKGKGSSFWGDNLQYTDDRWRNWMSELKGPNIAGIVFDTWNGYTEGYAGVPSSEHSSTVSNWLTHLLEPDPRNYNHMHYVDGRPTHRVYGAICEKWLRLGADRGFGVPTTEESPSGPGRVSFFADGLAGTATTNKAIYWSQATGAHEIHGLIAQTYWKQADAGRLGLPISDEESSGGASVSRFERGRIEWTPGEASGRITYT